MRDSDMQPEGRSLLSREAARSGLRLIDPRSLEDGIAERMALYDAFLDGRPCAAFVNIGGASANIGEEARALELAPGINLLNASLRGDGSRLRDGRPWRAGDPPAEPPRPGPGLRHALGSDPFFPRIGESRIYKVYDRGLYRRKPWILPR
ncbi:MAG: hypothetical protein M0C28_25470 [Candidatus Moduliflexus flocculans]|nr:hypothetical protein [Candidatus Moduliflexus flocculans]